MAKPTAVIILNWNKPIYTNNCITSIKNSCNIENYEIIVADNGSTDGSVELIRSEHPEVTIIENGENLGYAGGNNQALEYSIQAGYRYSLVLNNDTLVKEEVVAPLMNYLEQGCGTAAVQPLILRTNPSESVWNGGSFFLPLLGITYSRKSLKSKMPDSVDWLTGCCIMFKNEVLQKEGLFNERFFLYHEDVELSLRLRKKDYTLTFVPAVKIYHEAGISGQQKNKEGNLLPIIHYYNTRNKLWVNRKYCPAIYFPAILLYQFFFNGVLLLYFILRERYGKAGAVIKGVKDGLFTPLSLIYK